LIQLSVAAKVINLDYLEENERLALTELKLKIKRLLGSKLLAIILYGSKARGDYDIDSDTDIAIIVEDLAKELKFQILDIVTAIELEYLTPLSTLIPSKREFEFLKSRERRIALDIEREGIEI